MKNKSSVYYKNLSLVGFRLTTSIKSTMKKIISILFLISFFFQAQAQEAEEKPQRFFVNGYVKTLQTAIGFRTPFFDTLFTDNLLHNRINTRWDINEKWIFRGDLRTRVFYGELVKQNPQYADQVEATANDFFNLSTVLIDRDAIVMHSMIDRFYFEYLNGNWEIRLGRQRVNWGINTVWNPNDIFNAFSFTDFDYEERPGSDALRVRYFTGFASSVEFAVKAFDNWDEAVAAGLVKWNKWNYDFQILAGIVERDLVLGTGWAGNIKDLGLKGEASYFYSLVDTIDHSFAGTLSLDYSLKQGTFFSLGFLYNSNGASSTDVGGLFSFDLSAKNLYPYQFAIFTQASQPFSPLLNGSLALIYSPGKSNALFINPTITYSMAANWDLNLTGQLSFNQEASKYVSPVQAVFLRVKYSF